jgi:anti-sigma regulatory factor (Ser/Thr protein kinase)
VKRLELTGRAEPRTLGGFRRRLEAFLQEGGFAADARAGLVLALQEACANVIRHGGIDLLRVTVELERGEAVIRVHDYCAAEHAACLSAEPPTQLRPGGLGMHLIRSSTDDARLEPEGGGRLALVLRKRS